MKKIDFLALCLALLFFFVLGWLSNELYEELSNERKFDGFNLRNVNYTRAIERSYEMDGMGDWICSNVKGMTYNRCVEVASHECGHELVAGILEKDDTGLYKKFEAIIEEYEKENGKL